MFTVYRTDCCVPFGAGGMRAVVERLADAATAGTLETPVFFAGLHGVTST